MTSGSSNAVDIFYSYSHKDEDLRNKLVEHLSTLRRQGYINEWYDRQILAGTDWAQEIDAHLNSASLVLLLISPSFIASDYCYSIEMQRALERHHAKQVQIIPIILRPTDLSNTPFAALQFLPTSGKAITTWRNRDEALLDVARGIRKVIEGRTFSSIIRQPFMQPLWNIPYPRNPLFTGREHILELLAETLKTGETTAVTQPQALSGLGGIGKTQTAIEYAYRFRSNYNAVLWARADTRDNLVQDYVAIARLLDLPEQHQQDQPRTVEAVKQWLRGQHQWLLILDNADDLRMVRDFLPETDSGQVLMTTRAQAMRQLARRLEIDRMEQAEGTHFLLRRACILEADTPLDKASPADLTNAQSIVQIMEGLPLALDQAGAYIEETSCGLAGYLQRYQQRRTELLKMRGGYTPDHPEPVATTWSLSFENVEHANAASADLLRFCAFLAPDAIPEELILEGAADLTSNLQHLATDPFALDTAIKELLLYSLIRRDAERKLLSVHRLVQVVLNDAMDENTKRRWAEQTICAVNRAFPRVEFTVWEQCRRCLPHAQSCVELINHWNIELPEATSLLGKAAYFLRIHGQYLEAEPLYQLAIAIDEKKYGSDHLDLAYRSNGLGLLYYDQGKYAEAEALFQRAITIGEQKLGPDHPDLMGWLNNLGLLYSDQGKYTEAEALYRRAIATDAQKLGPDHPCLAYKFNGLGLLYYDQGKYTEAEALFQRAIAIGEQKLGLDHPDLAKWLNNFGLLYYDQGKYTEAEALFHRAIAIGEQKLGPDHPDLASRLNNLGLLYYNQGKYTEAEALFHRAITISEQKLGLDHPDLPKWLNNLANLYKNQGKNTEAEALFQRSKQIQPKLILARPKELI